MQAWQRQHCAVTGTHSRLRGGHIRHGPCLIHQKRRCPGSRRLQAAVAADQDMPAAVLFDCDGVLVDTEAQGHRVSFNRAFKQKGLEGVDWSTQLYGELLKIGGGKERMTHYFSQHPDEEPFKSRQDPKEQQAFIKELHLLKTDLFMALIEEGSLPLRPGVKRLVGAEAGAGRLEHAEADPLLTAAEEAIAAGVAIAVCSTSNERAVQRIVDVMLGKEISPKMPVFAGDVVPKKKPAPDIYQLAAKNMGLDPGRCVVIEDSHIGAEAAKAAGMRCVVTTSSYTADEDFSKADKVYDCIGDAGDERFGLKDLAALLQGPVKTAAAAS